MYHLLHLSTSEIKNASLIERKTILAVEEKTRGQRIPCGAKGRRVLRPTCRSRHLFMCDVSNELQFQANRSLRARVITGSPLFARADTGGVTRVASHPPSSSDCSDAPSKNGANHKKI